MSILNSNAINKIKDAVISQIRPIVLRTGKNLFNKDTVVSGYLNSTGTVMPGGSYYVSDFIEIIEGATIYFSHTTSSSDAHICFYDYSKTLIPSSAIPLSAIHSSGKTFIAKGSYMRISTNNPESLQVEYGDHGTAYEPYKAQVSMPNLIAPQSVELVADGNPIVFPHGKNLFNKDTVLIDYYLSESGTPSSSVDYFISDFIKVRKNEKIKISHLNSQGNIYVCFYDEKFQLVQAIPNLDVIANGNVVTSVGAYMKVCNRGESQLDVLQVEYGEVTTEYKPYSNFPTLPDFLNPQKVEVINQSGIAFPHGKNLFNKDTVLLDQYLPASGTPTSSPNYFTSDYIKIIEGAKIKISHLHNQGIVYVCFYDEKFQLVQAIPNPDVIANDNVVTGVGNYMRVCGRTAEHLNVLQIEYGEVTTSYEAYSYSPTLPDFLNPQKVEVINQSSIVYPSGKNLFDKERVILNTYIDSLGNEKSDATFFASDFIKVIKGARVVFNYLSSSAVANVCFYDINKNFIAGLANSDVIANGNVVVCQGEYLRVSGSTSFTDFNTFQVEYGEVPTGYEKYSSLPTLPNLQKPQPVTLVDDAGHLRSTDRYNFGILNVPQNYRLLAAYEDYFLIGSTNTVKFGSAGINGYGISESDITDTLNIAELPELYEGSTVANAAIFKGENGFVTLLFTNKNQVYYSDGGVFGDFKLSDVWTMPGEEFRHPKIEAEDKDPSGNRYRFYMPDDIASRGRQFTWFNSLVHLKHEGVGTITADTLCFANYQVGKEGSAVPLCVFSTYNGKDIYIQYMFGINAPKVKMAGTDTYKSVSYPAWGESLDTGGFVSDYTGGLTLRKRIPIAPSKAESQPIELFEIEEGVAISSITRGINPTAILTSAAGLVVGDVVFFDGDASDMDWNSLRNTTATTTSGGNGRFYNITEISGTDVKLSEAIGNPNNNIFCRHIHSINPFANGILIASGENYPTSWVIWNSIDHRVMTSSRWQNNIRINSSEDGLQRACGILLLEDGKILFASDELSTIKTSYLEINGVRLNTGSGGLWHGNLSDIDDSSLFENKLWNSEQIFKLVDLNGRIFVSTLGGVTHVSFDKGKTFEHVYTDGYSKQVSIGWDKGGTRFFFGRDVYIEFK